MLVFCAVHIILLFPTDHKAISLASQVFLGVRSKKVHHRWGETGPPKTFRNALTPSAFEALASLGHLGQRTMLERD